MCQPNSLSNLTTSKDVTLKPNNKINTITNEENDIMSKLNKLPNITIFKVPESPKLNNNSNVMIGNNVLTNTLANNLVNTKKVLNDNAGNLRRNSNLKQTLKRKQQNKNTTLTNNADEIIQKNLETYPEKYPKKNNKIRTSSPNAKKTKMSKTISLIEFTELKPENNIGIKVDKSDVSEDFTFIDISAMDQVNIVPLCQTLDLSNDTETGYDSFVTGLNHSESSIGLLKIDKSIKVDNIEADTVGTETKKFCDNLSKTN